MGTYESVRLVEALRSGVSSRKVSAVFSKGREDILTEVLQDLEHVQRDGVSKGFLFRGDYGEGKTHLLNQIFNEAESRNFVVSLLPLSKETPFNNLRKVYPNVVAATYLPGALMPGFEWKLRQLHPDSVKAEAILDFCRKRLHPKIELVFRNYLREGDPYNRFRLYADLAGQFTA